MNRWWFPLPEPVLSISFHNKALFSPEFEGESWLLIPVQSCVNCWGVQDGALQMSPWEAAFTTAPQPEKADVLEILEYPGSCCGCRLHGSPLLLR